MGLPLSVYFTRMRLAPLFALTIALLVPASSALSQDAPGINPSFTIMAVSCRAADQILTDQK